MTVAPQLASPFMLDFNGKPVTNAQDSPEDVSASVFNLMCCIQGGKLNDPAFGIPSPLFEPVGPAGLDASTIVAAVQQQEPRATQLLIGAVADLLAGASTQDLTVSVGSPILPVAQ